MDSATKTILILFATFLNLKKTIKGKILVHGDGTIMLSENDAAQEIPQFIRFYITYV